MSNISHTILLHNTLALDVDTVQERCILWAQSVDRPDSWMALRNLWILTSRRNPWIAQVVACAICGFCQILRILQIITL